MERYAAGFYVGLCYDRDDSLYPCTIYFINNTDQLVLKLAVNSNSWGTVDDRLLEPKAEPWLIENIAARSYVELERPDADELHDFNIFWDLVVSTSDGAPQGLSARLMKPVMNEPPEYVDELPLRAKPGYILGYLRSG